MVWHMLRNLTCLIWHVLTRIINKRVLIEECGLGLRGLLGKLWSHEPIKAIDGRLQGVSVLSLVVQCFLFYLLSQALSFHIKSGLMLGVLRLLICLKGLEPAKLICSIPRRSTRDVCDR